MNHSGLNIKQNIIDKSIELGFSKIGFARYELLKSEVLKLNDWLNKGYHADMLWMENNKNKREDIRFILENATSVISLAYNYNTPFKHQSVLPKISRYAWGKDYHKIIKSKLKELCSFIEKQESGIKTKFYVDDGPVMEKAWAVKAGIGWQGKNTNIIDPDIGSYFFLSEIITNTLLYEYNKPIDDLCGSCRICLDACPTDAFPDEYILDSNRCISYQAIENRNEIPESIDLNNWIFGCDICQEVCPYNKDDYFTKDESFYPKQNVYNKTIEELDNLSEEEFNLTFSDSPVKRTKYSGWKRNLKHNIQSSYPPFTKGG